MKNKIKSAQMIVGENQKYNKIIGFLISPNEINFEYDFFKIGLQRIEIENLYFHIYIWGIGDIEKCKIKDNYTLSFPITDNLLDRNILIKITNTQIILENDWLGSIPVFYNQKELIVSTIPGLCLRDKTFDQEGLINYFEFGYSVFEHTPFRDVKFFRYYCKVSVNNDLIDIRYKNDPILEKGLFEKTSTSLDAIDGVKEYVNTVEEKVKGDIILPTSGGYDSRLLNWAIGDKNRIRSFTYGISTNQSKSKEVIYARKIAEIYGTKWNQIELSHYNDYIENWHSLFGFSTHSHGMYHIEFYNNILSNYNFEESASLLSGIVGDIWAGSIDELNISSPEHIIKLGYTHELNLESKYLICKQTNEIITNYYETNKLNLQLPQFQIVSTIRIKLILLSYLLSIPEYYGIPVWTPFLNCKVALAMLRLPKKLRQNRLWQQDFFKKENIDIENMKLVKSNTNYLNHQAAKNHIFEAIQPRYFENILSSKKILSLNKKVNSNNIILEFILTQLKVRSILRRLGLKKVGYLKHLSNYYTIKAIEKSFR